MSAAYAVELLISMIHHPKGNKCSINDDIEKLDETELGSIP